MSFVLILRKRTEYDLAFHIASYTGIFLKMIVTLAFRKRCKIICALLFPFLVLVSGSLDNGFWRLNLPPSIRDRQHFKRLVIDDTEVYLLGTSHVSTDSCDDLKILMNHLKPDVLFVELCPQRIPILFQEDQDPQIEEEKKAEEDAGFFQTMKTLQANGMSRAGALSTILLTKVQGDYADTLGVKVGQEFKEAYVSSQNPGVYYISWCVFYPHTCEIPFGIMTPEVCCFTKP